MQVNTISERIKDFIVKHFPLARNRNINESDNLLESGILDSLGILEIVTFIENEFQMTLYDDDLVPENFQSIKYMSNFIQNSCTEKGCGAEK